MKDTFEDSSAPTPLFFVLFPGVDPGGEIEKLGRELGFTESNGRYKSISMGQGQEKNAEDALVKYAEEGGWLFLQVPRRTSRRSSSRALAHASLAARPFAPHSPIARAAPVACLSP